jgi:endonuclease/exonuclease/phosphatase family metal-dependent hydrolase
LRTLFLSLFLLSSLSAKTFTVASYNVQNLFDVKKNGIEYIDYIPHTKALWNRENYRIKLENLAQVINEINPDIIALQEIESDLALKHLQCSLGRLGSSYKYRAITQVKQTTVHTAVLSKYPINFKDELEVNPDDGIRAILDVEFDIEGHPFRMFVNHWKSKRGPESKRLPYAKALQKLLKLTEPTDDYIILGDFNENYNEHFTFKKSQKHNDTKGITGINHILKTIHGNKLNTYDYLKSASKGSHYNLWMDVAYKNRWSYLFRGRNSTLDNMLIPKSLADNFGIDYVLKSFKRFTPDYLVKGRKIFRWKFSKKGGIKHHLGQGYSDHLPIVAKFSY